MNLVDPCGTVEHPLNVPIKNEFMIVFINDLEVGVPATLTNSVGF